jgi:hypothetical protein
MSVYLMTAHGTFVGTDDKSTLVQVALSEASLPRLLCLNQDKNGHVVRHHAMREYEIEVSRAERKDELSFVKGGKYLSAQGDLTTLTANRSDRHHWEIFSLVPVDRIADILAISFDRNDQMKRFRRIVLKLQQEGKPVKIHCGSGRRPRSGFLNLDKNMMAPWMFLSNPDEYFVFPFADWPWDLPDNCVDYIYDEDFIEHITQLMQFQFLAETLRVLKPGGWHRVNTPNLITAMKKHSDFTKGFRGVYTGELKYGHLSIFSPASLKEVAQLVGYREVVFTTRHHGVSPYAERDFRPEADRDDIVGNIYADLLK